MLKNIPSRHAHRIKLIQQVAQANINYTNHKRAQIKIYSACLNPSTFIPKTDFRCGIESQLTSKHFSFLQICVCPEVMKENQQHTTQPLDFLHMQRVNNIIRVANNSLETRTYSLLELTDDQLDILPW